MSLFYDTEKYELGVSTETDSLLAELPFDLIKESIVEQINDPMSTNVDYIDIVLDKVTVFKEEYEDNEEILHELNNSVQTFFTSIIYEINNKFKLGLDMNSICSHSNIVEIGEVLYRYFVLRYVKNISKFITKYIIEHRKELSEYYSDKNKKDVSTMALKKQIKNADDLVIISNLPSIIKYIINLDIDPVEFIELNTGADNYEGTFIKNMIKSGELINDFVYDYIQLSLVEHDYLIDDIQTDIKIRIIKKIGKK